ncbi:hypothetical protein [Azospirillum canadense]|uniref:hypothetical protein n=1 Tax=Azospirillum canadense TaxID=403962 RepID=UPI002226F64F|nr:hypothetical protein [Azospirillum canadense]MCW2240620.1 hypothetical protein [Azospirillum canadense]
MATLTDATFAATLRRSDRVHFSAVLATVHMAIERNGSLVDVSAAWTTLSWQPLDTAKRVRVIGSDGTVRLWQRVKHCQLRRRLIAAAEPPVARAFTPWLTATGLARTT